MKMCDVDLIIRKSLNDMQIPKVMEQSEVLKIWDEKKTDNKITMKDWFLGKSKVFRIAIIFCVFLLALSSTYSVYAIVKKTFPSAGKALEDMGKTEIASYFDGSNTGDFKETGKDDTYTYTLLGVTEGQRLDGSNKGEEGFFAVVVIQKNDGTKLTLSEYNSDNQYHFISPLIQGLKPWKYNLASMNGRVSMVEQDDVIYVLIECDEINYFADRTIYLCISDTFVYSSNAYNYDEETGDISRNENYPGLNLLFEIPMDESKADEEKANEYIERMKEKYDK